MTIFIDEIQTKFSLCPSDTLDAFYKWRSGLTAIRIWTNIVYNGQYPQKLDKIRLLWRKPRWHYINLFFTNFGCTRSILFQYSMELFMQYFSGEVNKFCNGVLLLQLTGRHFVKKNKKMEGSWQNREIFMVLYLFCNNSCEWLKRITKWGAAYMITLCEQDRFMNCH